MHTQIKAFTSYQVFDKKGNLFTTTDGMDLRDYFAAKAMQGIFASGNLNQSDTYETIAKDSYELADAMLKAREA